MNRYVVNYSIDKSTSTRTIIEYKEAEVVADAIETAHDELNFYFGINGIHGASIDSICVVNDDPPGVYSDKYLYSKTKLKKEV